MMLVLFKFYTIFLSWEAVADSGGDSRVRQTTLPNAQVDNRTLQSTWSDADNYSGPTRSSLSSHGYNNNLNHQTTEGAKIKEDNTQSKNETNGLKGDIDIYFVDGDSLYQFNLKSGTKLKLLTGVKYANDIFVDSRRNMLYLLANQSMKSFKTDGKSLTDGTTLFTDKFDNDYFFFQFVIVHDYIYYTNIRRIKKVKVDTRSPTIEIVKTFKGYVSHMELHTETDNIKWLYVLIEMEENGNDILVKCTLDAIRCVTIKVFYYMFVEMFKFYGLNSIIYSDDTVGLGIFHLNDSSMERIGHNFRHLVGFYILGQRIFYREVNRISVFNLKSKKSRVIVRLQSSIFSTVIYAIDLGIERGNDNMVHQTTWHNSIEADNGKVSSNDHLNPIDSNHIIMMVTGAVIFILAVGSGCIGYKKCLTKRKARNVQRMVRKSKLEKAHS